MLLTADDAVLLLIDLQQRLVPVLHDQETVVARGVRLAEAGRLMGGPGLATGENPGRPGPPLSAYPQKILAKTAFSAAGAPGLTALLSAAEASGQGGQGGQDSAASAASAGGSP